MRATRKDALPAQTDDDRWMIRALAAASRAAELGEVPVGAVVVLENRRLATGFNLTVSRADPAGHAEIVALRRAARRVGNHRLCGATLYASLEPCVMCVGAIVQARIARVVYAAADPKAGALSLLADPDFRRRVNHRFEITGGIRAPEAATMLRNFFSARR